jgi:hypothetical protein
VTIELHALDVSAGEAIVRCLDRWYRVYRRKSRWCLDDLGADESPILRWGTSQMRLRRDYSSFADLAAALTAATSLRAASPEEVSAALRVGGVARRKAGSLWSNELLSMFQGRVDNLLARRGCSAKEAFPLILETFRRAYALGLGEPEALEALLPQIAIQVLQERRGKVKGPRVPRRDPRAPVTAALDGSLQEALAALDPVTLRCLAVCSDSRLCPPHLTKNGVAAKLFSLQEDDVQLRIGVAAARLGCSQEHLLSPAMHETYKRELSRRLD